MQKIKILHVYKSFNVYNGLIEILTILAQNLDHQKFEMGVCVNEYRKMRLAEFEELGAKIFNLDIKTWAGIQLSSSTGIKQILNNINLILFRLMCLKLICMGQLQQRWQKFRQLSPQK